jgi:hypothetical protein
MTGSIVEANGKSTKPLDYVCRRKSLNRNARSTCEGESQPNEPKCLVIATTALEAQYQAEYRGVVQYYMLAHNVGWFNKVQWVTETSLLKTLAGKHKSSVAAMAQKYKATTETIKGPRKCLKVVVQRENGKKPLVAQFGGIPLQRKQDAILVDHVPQFYMTNRSELLQRVLADTCELCGSREQVEVHHIRKLADVEKQGKQEKPKWMKQMAARRRKTLIVCRRCHEAIHAGRSTKPIRK